MSFDFLKQAAQEISDPAYNQEFVQRHPACQKVSEAVNSRNLGQLDNATIGLCLEAFHRDYQMSNLIRQKEKMCQIMTQSYDSLKQMMGQGMIPKEAEILQMLRGTFQTLIPCLEEYCRHNQVELKLGEFLLRELNRLEQFHPTGSEWAQSREAMEKQKPSELMRYLKPQYQQQTSLDQVLKEELLALYPGCRPGSEDDQAMCVLKKASHDLRCDQLFPILVKVIHDGRGLCLKIQKMLEETKTVLQVNCNLASFVIHRMMPQLHQICQQVSGSSLDVLLKGSQLLQELKQSASQTRYTAPANSVPAPALNSAPASLPPTPVVQIQTPDVPTDRLATGMVSVMGLLFLVVILLVLYNLWIARTQK